MKHRTWLIEVLRLHFEEKLPRIEAGRRLGIPITTACDLFVRFRKAGLPVVPAPCEIPVARKRPRRPNFPRDFKIALVAQSMQPGVSVAQLVRENNINDNLLFNWRRRYQQELMASRADDPLMLPVMLAAEPDPGPAHPL